jgi:thiol:disulfide interchange protein DsbD
VVLLSKLTASSSNSARQAQIGADVKYLVCREICVPGKDHLELTLPVAQGTGSNANTAQIESTKSHLPRRLPQRAKVSARSDGDSIVLVVTRKGALGTITDFIPADEQVIENAALPKIDQRGTETLITLKKSEQLVHPISRLRGLLICGEQAYNIAVPMTSNQQPSSKSSK